MNMPTELWTIGHSGRTFEEFLDLLNAFQIKAVADVRRFPVSSRFPYFSQMELFKNLTRAQIEYVPFTELGGRRRPLPNSPNTAWRNESFRGYADFMGTQSFETAMKRLIEIAASARTAILCAEAIWWRCHRALIADYLKSKGVTVIHILSAKRSQEHPYTSAARMVDGQLKYTPAEALELVVR